MNNSFSIYDWIIFGTYFAILVYFSLQKSRVEDEENFILAGRKLTLPAFIATLVSTWYGGILGVGEYTYLYGISNWVVFGLPYYLFAVIFAFFFAEKIRKTNLLTLPDQFQLHYGKGPAVVSGILLSIATLPAPYILMTGILINLLTGLSFLTSILLGSLFSLTYVYRSGFRMVVKTDILQFVLMFIGFIILFFYLNFSQFPFWELTEKLPDRYFSLSGGLSWSYLLAWYIIASQTLIDPNFYQRCYAAKTPKTAKKGILISILFWAFFDFLTTTAGLYSRVLLGDNIQATNAFPLLGMNFLPVIFKGLFFTSLIATIMSTVDSFSFVSAISLGKDAVNRLLNKTDEPRHIRLSLIFITIISLVIILFERSIIGIWFDIGSITVPAILIPILFKHFTNKQFHPGRLQTGMILSSLATIAAVIGKDYYKQTIGRLDIFEQPVYLGILLMLLFVFLSLQKEKTSGTSDKHHLH